MIIIAVNTFAQCIAVTMIGSCTGSKRQSSIAQTASVLFVVDTTDREMVDSRLQPPGAQLTICVYLLIFISERNLVGIDAAVLAVTPSPLGNRIHMMHRRDQCMKT